MRRILLILPFLLACNPSLMVPSAHLPASCPAGSPLLETMTWNVGLAPGVVPYARPRIQAVADEIVKFRDMGVICLQEVWTQEARDAIIAKLALPEDQVYYVDTRGAGEEPPGSNVCTAGQIGPVAACVRERCDGLESDEETTHCAQHECHDALVSLYLRGGRECLDCLAASVGEDVDTIERQCTKPAPGVTRAYDGQNGVMLISRWPLQNRQWEMLPASYSNRVALYATIGLQGHEPLEVACTHVSTWNELPPAYKDENGRKVFSSWDDEMIEQVTRISRKLSERAQGRPQLFLGDMNSGPEIGSYVRASMPKVWAKIRALGFSSPAASAWPTFCSTCGSNSLRDPGSRNYLIDHVLVRDPIGGSRLTPRCTRSVLDEEHKRYFKGYGDSLLEEHLSDHYAVTVTFSYE